MDILTKTDKKRPKYFTPNEISYHNSGKDLWVSFLGKVYDLTPYVLQNAGDVLLKPIIDSAGQDISHWFDPKTNDIRKHVDSTTGCLSYYTQHGRFSHIPPEEPSSDWANDFGIPWWKDNKYCIGILSKKTRFIKIINALTLQSQIIEVILFYFFDQQNFSRQFIHSK
jgi:predicted heme/steroid binding protein